MGVAIYPGMATVDGVRGDHVLVAPPYNVLEVDLQQITKVMRKAYDVEESIVDDSLHSAKANGSNSS